MTLINKIARLTRIPSLLKRKREAERESKKNKKKQPGEEQSFPIDQKSAFRKNKAPRSPSPSGEQASSSKTANKNLDTDTLPKDLGNQIDIRV